MRNPNRLVGVMLAVVLCLGAWWWARQEWKTRGLDHPPQTVAPQPAQLISAVTPPSSLPSAKNPSTSTRKGPRPNAPKLFREWASTYLSSPESTRTQMLHAGLELARERQVVQLMRAATSPRRFMRESLPYEVTRQLPAEMRQFIEHPINALATVEGTWSVDGFGSNSRRGVALRVGDQSIEASGLPTLARMPRGQSFPINGMAIGKRAVLVEEPVRVLSSLEHSDLLASGQTGSGVSRLTGSVVEAPAGWVQVGGQLHPVSSEWEVAELNRTLVAAQAALSLPSQADIEPGETELPPANVARQGKGKIRLLAARFVFPDDPTVPLEQDDLVQMVNRASSVMKDWSYGQAEVIPTYTPLIKLTQSRQYYIERELFFIVFFGSTNATTQATVDLLMEDARRSVAGAGYDLTAFDHFHAIVPPIPDSSTRGVGDAFSPPIYARGFGTNQTLVFPSNAFSGITTNGAGANDVQRAFNGNVATLLTAIGFAFGVGEANGSETRSPDRPPDGPPLSDPFPRNIVDPIYVDAENWHGFEAYNRNGLFAQGSTFGGNFGFSTEIIASGRADDGTVAQLSQGFFFLFGLQNLLFDYDEQDPFDIMGDAANTVTESAHYSVFSKVTTGWLPTNYVAALSGSSTTRLYAFDAPTLSTGKTYAIAIRKDVLRTNWLEYRTKLPNNPWVSSGVLLHWGRWAGTEGGTQLIDATPGTPQLLEDAAITLGHTFSDSVNQIHITALRKGVDGEGEWMDVVVHQGSFPENRPPTFTLQASQTEARSDEVIGFTAADIVDPDGDAVAVHWNFSDGTFGDNSPVVLKSFTSGQHVVRCEVSDMKGGLSVHHVVITVDGVLTTQVRGRVIDVNRSPVMNVRVAIIGTNGPQATFTDSDGFYTLTGVESEVATNVAHLYGYRVVPLGFDNPAPLQAGLIAELNYLALPDVSVSVEAFGDPSGSPGTPMGFRFKRQHSDISQPMAAFFRVDGSAQPGVHYSGLVSPQAARSLSNEVIFPPGQDTVDVPLSLLSRPGQGGQRSVVVSVLLDPELLETNLYVTNINNQNIILEDTVFRSYPDWYRATPSAGRRAWLQTRPRYVVGVGEATLHLLDTNAPPTPILTVLAMSDLVLENGYDAGQVVFALDEPLPFDLNIAYDIGGNAVAGLDYVTLPGLVRIPAGSPVAVVPVFGVANQRIDGPRTVEITARPSAAFEIRTSTATVLLEDDDLPSVWVSSPASEAFGSDGRAGAFRIARTGPVAEPLTVHYVLRGTATNGVDFRLLSGRVIIPAGSDRELVLVEPISDGRLQPSKTVILQVSSSTTYNIESHHAATVILHDDLAPIMSVFPIGDGTPLAEGAAGGGFRVVRSGSTNAPVFVRYEVGGTARNGLDYRSIGTGVIIPAGAAEVIVPVLGIPDDLQEYIETVTLHLSPGDTYAVDPTAPQASLQFEQDGGAFASIGFQLESSEVRESVGGHEIGIHLSGPPQFAVTNWVAEVRVIAGSAVLSNDFVFTQTNSMGSTGYIAFDHYNRVDRGADEIVLTTNIHLTLLDNSIKQNSRTLLLALYTPNILLVQPTVDQTNFFFWPTNWAYRDPRFHWVTILDDDAAVVSVEAATQLGYEKGAVSGSFRILREGTNGFAEPMTVRYQITGSASEGADYAGVTRFATIPANSAEVMIPIVPVDDQTFEGPESVQLRLIIADGGSIDTNRNIATVTLVDDDGTIQFSKLEYRFDERAGVVQVPVIRNGDLQISQTVEYSVHAGTAEADVDFTATDGVLTFLPGETAKAIQIRIFDDPDIEAIETLDLLLGDVSGGVASAGQTRARVHIESEDSGFLFSTNIFAVPEFDSVAAIRVLRVGSLAAGASVRVAASTGPGDAAVLGQDYLALDEVITFTQAETTKTLLLPILDDTAIEGDENLRVTLSSPQGGSLSPTGRVAIITVRDDDTALEFGAPSFSISENLKVARVTVRRQGGVLNPVSVSYRSSDGTARAGSDYVSTSGTLTLQGERFEPNTSGGGGMVIVAGQASAIIEIPLVDDTVGEPNENFILTLSNPRTLVQGRPLATTVLGPISQTSVQILDNELPGNPDLEYAEGGLRFSAVDPDGSARVGDAVNAIFVQPNGRVVIAGDFTEVNDYTFRHVARVDLQGRLDLGFNPGVGSDGTVLALAGTDDGKVYLAGSFTNVGGLNRFGVARLNADGGLDTAFDPGLGSRDAVRAIALQEGGYLLAGGDFIRFDGIARQRLVRLNPDGFVDPAFAPQIDGRVNSILVQDDGRILIGGGFSTVGGLTRPGLARLNTNGTVDVSFTPGTGVQGTVLTLALQATGTILVGGTFESINGLPLANLARLNADGTPDGSFALGTPPNGAVRSLSVHSSGKIYVAGEFTEIDGLPRSYFARLRSEGGVDVQFDVGIGADAPGRVIVANPNTSAYLGGEFSQINSVPRHRFARIHGDEKLTLAGVEFVQGQIAVDEGVGRVTLNVRRTGDTNLPFTVNYATVPQRSTAVAGLDYLPASGSLGFPAGVMLRSFEVTIQEDQVVELPEIVSVRLTSTSSGVDLSGNVNAIIQILDNEASVSFAATNFTVAEGAGSIHVTLLRQGNTNTTASVLLFTQDGSAREGQDYQEVSQRVEFAVNEVSKSVSIPILEDRLAEGTESFQARIADASSGLLIGIPTTTVNITDNDFDRIILVATALVSDADGNGAIDPSELATLSIALRNIGTSDTTNLVATLLPEGNVLPVTATQTYGRMLGEGPPVSRSFSLRNSAATGGSITVTLGLKDGQRDLGTVSTVLSIGRQSRTFANTNTIVIRDSDVADPYPSTINVSGLSGAPVKVTVGLSGITHRAMEEIDMMLVAPNGLATVFLSDVGLGSVTNLQFTIDPDAATLMPNRQRIGSGTYRPVNWLVNDQFDPPAPGGVITKTNLDFSGINANGTWSLYVVDDTEPDGGQIVQGWSLSIQTLGEVLRSIDVGVSLTGPAEPVVLGGAFTYSLRAVNNGPSPASGIVMRLTLPSNVTVESLPEGVTRAGSVVTANVPSLEVDGFAEFLIQVKPGAVGSIVSTATITAVESDIFAGNNSALLTTSVQAESVAVQLSIARLPDGRVDITWPRSSSGVLETTARLGGAWNPVSTPAPSAVGDLWSVKLEPGTGVQFYRLRSQ